MEQCCKHPASQHIRRATTPKQTFTLELDNVMNLTQILVTYAQRGIIVFERDKDSMDIEDNVVSFRLTQEETLALRQNVPVEIQMKVWTPDENVLASDIFEVSVERILNEEVFI